MSGFNVPIGSALAAKYFSAAVFAGVQSSPGFMNLLRGDAPQMGDAASKLKGQTSPSYPIVQVTDLSQSAGDRISVDLFNIFTGKPVMGDRRIEGKGMNATTSSQDVWINRSRGMSDTGGKMIQKRTRHNLRTVVQAGLTGWAQRLEDQRCLVALAGARGSQSTADWVVPLQSDPDFMDIMVNGVQAPTNNRHFFGSLSSTTSTYGAAAKWSDVVNYGITTAAAASNFMLSLSDIDAIGALIKESNVPLQHIMLKDDPYGWNSPLWVMFVTQRQWALMKKISASLWQTALQYAIKRFDGQRHPLFMGDSIMWNGILVKPIERYAIRFNPGDSVQECQNSSSTTETATNVPTTFGANQATNSNWDRAILVGAQALIKAYGNEESSMYHYGWNEELVDHKSAVEISLSMMEGTAKTRFTINGTPTDHGVMVIDSYAPAIGTADYAGATASGTGKY